MSVGECGDCSGGRLCFGGFIFIFCYIGFYCLVGDVGNFYFCLILIYNDREGVNFSDWCLFCFGGYMCFISNLIIYELYLCFIGMYCFNVINVVYECLVGIYRLDF